jgi:hypothetical protein
MASDADAIGLQAVHGVGRFGTATARVRVKIMHHDEPSQRGTAAGGLGIAFAC